MKIGFCLFEKWHQRRDIGSSRIRGHWLIKYMPEAEVFCQGKKYDVIVFQKTYWKEMARAFKGIKILDLCDPDWLDGVEIVNILKEMDIITTSTEKLKEDVSKFTNKPVYCIMDRIDFDTLLPPKKHEGRAKKVCWFGYIGNSDVLAPTLMKLKKMNLILKVISNESYMTNECQVENVKWDLATVNKEIQDCDFCLLPESLYGRAVYKSLNKTHQSWALGMPVAKTALELERFMDPAERQKEADLKYKWVMGNCNVKHSVSELRDIIIKLCTAKKKQLK